MVLGKEGRHLIPISRKNGKHVDHKNHSRLFKKPHVLVEPDWHKKKKTQHSLNQSMEEKSHSFIMGCWHPMGTVLLEIQVTRRYSSAVWVSTSFSNITKFFKFDLTVCILSTSIYAISTFSNKLIFNVDYILTCDLLQECWLVGFYDMQAIVIFYFELGVASINKFSGK